MVRISVPIRFRLLSCLAAVLLCAVGLRAQYPPGGSGVFHEINLECLPVGDVEVVSFLVDDAECAILPVGGSIAVTDLNGPVEFGNRSITITTSCLSDETARYLISFSKPVAELHVQVLGSDEHEPPEGRFLYQYHESGYGLSQAPCWYGDGTTWPTTWICEFGHEYNPPRIIALELEYVRAIDNLTVRR